MSYQSVAAPEAEINRFVIMQLTWMTLYFSAFSILSMEIMALCKHRYCKKAACQKNAICTDNGDYQWITSQVQIKKLSLSVRVCCKNM